MQMLTNDDFNANYNLNVKKPEDGTKNDAQKNRLLMLEVHNALHKNVFINYTFCLRKKRAELQTRNLQIKEEKKKKPFFFIPFHNCRMMEKTKRKPANLVEDTKKRELH